MFRRRKMRYALQVFRPWDRHRIFWTGDHHTEFRAEPRWFEHQLFQRGLTIGAEGAHVAEIPAGHARIWRILSGVDRAIERFCAARTEFLLENIQGFAARKGQIKIVMR